MAGPPKIRKNKKQKKTWEHKKNKQTTKKQFSETLGWTPFSSRLPQNCFFWFFSFFWFSQGFFGFLILLILGGPSKSLSELFLCFLCFLKVFWFSIWTYFSPQGICSFCLRLKPSELNTSFVLVQISIYKSECINCWLVSMRLPLAFPNSLTCSCEDTLSFTWNGWKSLRAYFCACSSSVYILFWRTSNFNFNSFLIQLSSNFN